MAGSRSFVPRLSGLPRHSQVPTSFSARTPRRGRGFSNASGGFSGEKDEEVQVISIKVAIRIRPLLLHEASHRDCVRASPNCVAFCDERNQERYFATDVVLDSRPPTSVLPNDRGRADTTSDAGDGPHATQAVVFEVLGRPLVTKALEGFNTCLLAYGHTGSGKTYTVLGEHCCRGSSESPRHGPESLRSLDAKSHSVGLLPRTLDELFSALREDSNTQCIASFYEIYNERVQDLLVSTLPSMSVDSENTMSRAKKKRPTVHFHPRFGAFVDGISEVPCDRLEQALHLLAVGAQARTTAVTGLNERSSRSHAVFALRIERPSTSNTVMMVDLAGREQERSTHAGQCCSERFKELTLINRSLFHLAHCVRTLAAEGSDRAGVSVSATGQGHHFRNSKLTMLLGHALAGNSHTSLIGTISPSTSAHEDSLATLRFCESTKQVRTRPVINNFQSEDAVRFLEDELRRLSMELNRARTGRQNVERQLSEAKNMCDHYRTSWKQAVERQKEAFDIAGSSRNRRPAAAAGTGSIAGCGGAPKVCSTPKPYQGHRSPRQSLGSARDSRSRSSSAHQQREPQVEGNILSEAELMASACGGGSVEPSSPVVGKAVAETSRPRTHTSTTAGSSEPPVSTGASTTASEPVSEASTPREVLLGQLESSETPPVPEMLVDQELKRAMAHWLEAAETMGGEGSSQPGRAAIIDTIQRLHSQLASTESGCAPEQVPEGNDSPRWVSRGQDTSICRRGFGQEEVVLTEGAQPPRASSASPRQRASLPGTGTLSEAFRQGERISLGNALRHSTLQAALSGSQPSSPRNRGSPVGSPRRTLMTGRSSLQRPPQCSSLGVAPLDLEERLLALGHRPGSIGVPVSTPGSIGVPLPSPVACSPRGSIGVPVSTPGSIGVPLQSPVPCSPRIHTRLSLCNDVQRRGSSPPLPVRRSTCGSTRCSVGGNQSPKRDPSASPSAVKRSPSAPLLAVLPAEELSSMLMPPQGQVGERPCLMQVHPALGSSLAMDSKESPARVRREDMNAQNPWVTAPAASAAPSATVAIPAVPAAAVSPVPTRVVHSPASRAVVTQAVRATPEVKMRLVRTERYMAPASSGRTRTTHEVQHWAMDMSPRVDR